jgi:hypothetical protein
MRTFTPLTYSNNSGQTELQNENDPFTFRTAAAFTLSVPNNRWNDEQNFGNQQKKINAPFFIFEEVLPSWQQVNYPCECNSGLAGTN